MSAQGYITAGAIALAAAGGWLANGWRLERAAEALRAEQNADALRRTNANIEVTARRLKEQEDADRKQAQRDARERAAADAIAAAERDRLRNEVSRLTRRAAADTSAAGKRTPAEALGAVFNACVARYRELERDATDDRSRGLSCEQRYDALTSTGTAATPTKDPSP